MNQFLIFITAFLGTVLIAYAINLILKVHTTINALLQLLIKRDREEKFKEKSEDEKSK